MTGKPQVPLLARGLLVFQKGLSLEPMWLVCPSESPWMGTRSEPELAYWCLVLSLEQHWVPT